MFTVEQLDELIKLDALIKQTARDAAELFGADSGGCEETVFQYLTEVGTIEPQVWADLARRLDHDVEEPDLLAVTRAVARSER